MSVCTWRFSKHATHWNEWTWSSTKKSFSRNSAQENFHSLSSLSSVFFPLIAYTALKCKESICLFSRCSHLTTVEKGCLLDCLHLPKNMKWSVCITEMLRMYDGDGFQFEMAEWKCEREKTWISMGGRKSHKHAFYSFFNLSHANVCSARLIKNTCLNFKQWDRF